MFVHVIVLNFFWKPTKLTQKLSLAAASASLVAQTVKHLPAMQETWVWSLGWKDPLEKGMTTHSNILAWRIPWTQEPGRLQSMGHKEPDMTERISRTQNAQGWGLWPWGEAQSPDLLLSPGQCCPIQLFLVVCMCAKSIQLCPTLCDPRTAACQAPLSMEFSRILEWVAMPSSRGSSRPRDQPYVFYISCTGRWVLYH